ncbi:hypothetical protein [Streptosporangium sp. NPDC051022]
MATCTNALSAATAALDDLVDERPCLELVLVEALHHEPEALARG